MCIRDRYQRRVHGNQYQKYIKKFKIKNNMKIIYFLFLLGLISTIHTETINELIDDLAKLIPDLKKDLQAQPAAQHQVVQVIVGQGFTRFEQSGSVQKILGVAEQFIDPFLANMQAQMKLPAREQQRLTDTIQKILWEDSEEWINFDVVFREEGSGQTKYICLLGRHSWETATTDWLIADIQATFTFANDIYVVQSCKKRFLRSKKCHNDYIQRPHAITEEEIIALNSFMQIVAFERFQELKGYNTNGFSLEQVFNQPTNENNQLQSKTLLDQIQIIQILSQVTYQSEQKSQKQDKKNQSMFLWIAFLWKELIGKSTIMSLIKILKELLNQFNQ
eukprot:TRINITY_DN6_c0_g2_i4.p1 TRINITY_DN6_c0_g2~~TRINITY_DN6_c0_g2_i4.p1  ORF type:complete len:334 (+),score=104.07 TRINITY_DN6_c0_g2_i4:79-1080(+)